MLLENALAPKKAAPVSVDDGYVDEGVFAIFSESLKSACEGGCQHKPMINKN